MQARQKCLACTNSRYGGTSGAIQPDRHMLQFRPLKLMDSVGIAEPEGIIDQASTRHVVVCDWIYSKAMIRLCDDLKQVCSIVVRLDGTHHSIDEVIGLVSILCQDETHAVKDGQLKWKWQAILTDIARGIVVGLVRFVITRNRAKQWFIAIREEDLQG